MLLNVSFIAACLLLVNVSQAAPVGEIATQNGLQTSNFQFQRRQTPTASNGPIQLTDDEKKAIEKSKLETKAKIDAAIAAGATIDQTELSAAAKKAIASNTGSDNKTIGKAIKAAIESLADQKLAEAKGKSSGPQRRQAPAGSLQLTEEEKIAVDKSKVETKAKIDAATAAGASVDPSEISAAVKKAIADTPNGDRKATGKAIKTAVESLADQKLAEAKGKPASRQRRSDLSEEAKAALAHVKKEGKARIEAVTSAGGTVEDSDILAVIKKADSENPNKDINTANAIKAGFISLTDQKLAEAKSKSSPQ
ncbi:uncharacterized protein MELLADRAFT_86056 [Melampsora larici-populina 98AG31]|uniref:Secreted protein n=1 Tax=Melampsora larici-populina (strain 98AG31 / pathotype 3-4-7) TaxID=747676 RepID=F4RKL9_MELLP|nr:uncharacterized protein MELLADRAFT_86056 [Melampsora larici-populina 98AG31]EGG07154.1 hypothetical protein MELLADRAFT_86056 [Melampsora larici-populina 98AG31]